MNPYASPTEQSYGHAGRGPMPYYASLQGDVLVVQKEASLPAVCMKCGTHDSIVRRTAKFQWTPVWARMLVPFCGIFGILAMLITTKRARLDVPLCAPCNSRWGSAVAVLVGGIVALVASLFSVTLFDAREIGIGLIIVVLVGFIGAVFGFIRPRMLGVHKIDDHNVELKNFHRGAAEEIAGALR